MTDKLFIIGNGFDLHHGLSTSYTNFRDNCVRKNQFLNKLLKEIYGNAPNQDMWWWNFEEMLSEIDYIHLHNTYNGVPLGESKVKNYFNNLPTFFCDWIKSKDGEIQKATPICEEIDMDAYFFTFNYTMLLERTYKIEKSRVWHIHHSTESEKDGIKIIVGHDSDERKMFSQFLKYKEENNITQLDFADDIRKIVAKKAKGVKNRIERHSGDFQKYTDIKQFYSMGFSFNDIDLPYIKAIVDVNRDIDKTHWTLYWFSDGENIKMKKQLMSLGVSENCIEMKKW